MKVEAARYEDGELILTVPRCPEVMRLCMSFKAGNYELKKLRVKRSLSANAYAWVLIDKLAATTGYTTNEIYRHTIKEIGGVSTEGQWPAEDAMRFKRSWERNGLGWQVDIMPSSEAGMVDIRAYYGSSVYNTQQMSRLIDKLVQDCKACGIETLPPDKLQSMIGEW